MTVITCCKNRAPTELLSIFKKLFNFKKKGGAVKK